MAASWAAAPSTATSPDRTRSRSDRISASVIAELPRGRYSVDLEPRGRMDTVGRGYDSGSGRRFRFGMTIPVRETFPLEGGRVTSRIDEGPLAMTWAALWPC